MVELGICDTVCTKISSTVVVDLSLCSTSSQFCHARSVPRTRKGLDTQKNSGPSTHAPLLYSGLLQPPKLRRSGSSASSNEADIRFHSQHSLRVGETRRATGGCALNARGKIGLQALCRTTCAGFVFTHTDRTHTLSQKQPRNTLGWVSSRS
jgi:hypothetical protein